MSDLSDLVSRLAHDKLEEAHDDVGQYLAQHIPAPLDRPAKLVGLLREAMDHYGEPVESGLYILLCDQQSLLREIAGGALGKGAKYAAGAVAAFLVAQFALAPAVALVVAALILEVVAVRGEKALCEELARRQGAPAKPGREAARKRAGVRARQGAAAKTGKRRGKDVP